MRIDGKRGIERSWHFVTDTVTIIIVKQHGAIQIFGTVAMSFTQKMEN